MSTFVNETRTITELNNFDVENHIGRRVSLSIEDLRFVMKKSIADSYSSFSHKGFTFFWISGTKLLAVDELFPLNKSIISSYKVALATPPLVNFEFDLAFVAKVTPPPAGIKLSEALQVVGYQGPRVTKLSQLKMYMLELNGYLESSSDGGGSGGGGGGTTPVPSITSKADNALILHRASLLPSSNIADTQKRYSIPLTDGQVWMVPYNYFARNSSPSVIELVTTGSFDAIGGIGTIKLSKKGVWLITGRWTSRLTQPHKSDTFLTLNAGPVPATDIPTWSNGYSVTDNQDGCQFSFVTVIDDSIVPRVEDNKYWLSICAKRTILGDNIQDHLVSDKDYITFLNIVYLGST